jgi:drug/metabolite transporter (DMT)-like permease
MAQTIIIGSIGLGLGWLLLFSGQKFVAPALASILNATTPLFATIFSSVILRKTSDRLTSYKCLGVVIGFSGIVVIFAPGILNGSELNVPAMLAILGTSACYGTSITWLKKLSAHISNIMVLFLQCMGGLLLLIPITIIDGIKNSFFTGEEFLTSTLAILYLSLFSTAIAIILFMKLIRDVGSIQAAAVTYLVPIVAILLDLFILKRWVGPHALLGILIVLSGIRLIHKPSAITPVISKI